MDHLEETRTIKPGAIQGCVLTAEKGKTLVGAVWTGKPLMDKDLDVTVLDPNKEAHETALGFEHGGLLPPIYDCDGEYTILVTNRGKEKVRYTIMAGFEG